MKQSEQRLFAEKTMRAIVRMSRNPLVSRRGNMLIKTFMDKTAEPEPKKKKVVEEG